MKTRTNEMPTIDQFRPVVLRVLSDGKEHAVRDIVEQVASELALSDHVRSQRIASGQLRYANRINWACSGLTQAGLIERSRRGYYRITANGAEVEGRGLGVYTEKDMLEWPAWQDYQDEIASR
ncbi:MAG: winged helix-turn-helix domain-containing protein [Actinomycetaceae bacterium]|nr:winged helix-turn-helix domain-containing protein [Actinomycetaceae bacterium]